MLQSLGVILALAGQWARTAFQSDMTLTFFGGVALAGGLACLGLAVLAALRSSKDLARYSFAGGMLLLALESLFTALSLSATLPDKLLHYQNVRLWTTSLLPGTWLLFSLSYARGNYRQFLSKWWPLLALCYALPGILIPVYREGLIVSWERPFPPYDSYLALTWPGMVLYSSFLVGCLLILMHLERTLRTSVGVMRWRIKFLVIGLLLLFGVRLYTASQDLLYSSSNLALQKTDVTALLLACALMALSFWRAGLTQVDVYPSPSLLQGSVTVLLAGLYLLLVGALAQVVTILGGDAAFGFRVFFVLASLVLLAILLLSERIRQHLRRWISRHFQRPQYDYRAVWATFADRTSFIMDKASLCQAVVKWTSDTFNVLSVTIWVADNAHQKLVPAASTALPQQQAPTFLPLDGEGAGMSQELKRIRAPIDLDAATEKWVHLLKVSTTSYFPNSGKRVCVPIVGRGELVGVLTLGDRVNGLPFTLEDFDLLKCVAQQLASHLTNIQLSEKLLQVRELEAFQTMAAFFAHDLKNVGSTLTLMLQNLGVHFDNPEFRQDALRSLSRSVAHLNDLISHLTRLRQKLEINRAPTDLNGLITSVLDNFPSPPGIAVTRHLPPLPAISLDGVQIQNVITNLLLNAVDAVGQAGEVKVETIQRNGYLCVSIRDNGSGMTPEFLAHSLFRPFQTTKKKGLGIGVFQSKMIIDAHHGKIEVESQPGKGTTFRVLLPLETKKL